MATTKSKAPKTDLIISMVTLLQEIDEALPSDYMEGDEPEDYDLTITFEQRQRLSKLLQMAGKD